MNHTNWASISAELLPKVLRSFVEHIGLAATMLLVEHFGGRRLYIPINPQEGHHLAKLIGLDNLVKLSRVYGAEDHFDIPRAMRALRQIRDDKIRAEYGPKSASALARENGLTERQIFNIVGLDKAANSSQSKLFG